MRNFIVQLSLRNHQIERFVEAFKKVDAKYSFFSIYADINTVENLPDNFGDKNQSFFAFAGIKAVKISLNPNIENFGSEENFNLYKDNYTNSFLYKDKDKFDQQYYNKLNLPLLNGNSKVINLADNLQLSFEKDMFIKPTSDLKGFTAGIIKAGETVQDYIKTTSRQTDWIKEPTLIGEVKDSHSEYRFFVVDGVILASSRYMLDKVVSVSKIIPDEVMAAAEKLKTIYMPDRGYTMDLALLNNGKIEIVEYNCINGSGTYDADLIMFVDYLKNKL